MQEQELEQTVMLQLTLAVWTSTCYLGHTLHIETNQQALFSSCRLHRAGNAPGCSKLAAL